MCSLIARRYGLPFDVVSLHQEYWDNVMDYALRTVRRPHSQPRHNVQLHNQVRLLQRPLGARVQADCHRHYASTLFDNEGRKWLATAVDPVKDQTDFLARISGKPAQPPRYSRWAKSPRLRCVT